MRPPGDSDTGGSNTDGDALRYLQWHEWALSAAIVLWFIAYFAIPGEWSVFWPMLIWAIAFIVHFLVVKSLSIDPEWIEERTARVTDESKDLGHIENIRGDYTGRVRPAADAADDDQAP